MKLTVDTEKDSPEKIKRVIEMLSSSLKKPRTKSKKGSHKKKEETLISIEFMNSDHKTGLVENNTEVSGLFTENREEEVKVGNPNVVEKVEQEKKSYKKITYKGAEQS